MRERRSAGVPFAFLMNLKLNGIAVNCVIGERPDERCRLQELRVDVELDVPDLAGETDSLSDTVDYAALADRIRSVLIAAECRMIERAAVVAARTCLEDEKVRSVRVRVVKRGAIEGLESAEVEYERGR